MDGNQKMEEGSKVNLFNFILWLRILFFSKCYYYNNESSSSDPVYGVFLEAALP